MIAMKNFILFILKFLLFLYLLVGVLLYVFQRKLLYFPVQKEDYPYEKMLLKYNGEEFNTIVLNQGQKRAIIYFGGNGESVVYNSKKFMKNFPNHTLYLVDYAGYGWSSGSPTQNGIFQNALHLYEHIESKHNSISLIGRSLGSGVASYVASKKKVEKLALITPFDSLKNVAQKMYPIYPIGLILKDHYNSVEYLQHKKVNNILIVMAKEDKLIPNQHSYTLAKSLPKDEVKVEVIEGAEHNSISNYPEYNEVLAGFMEKLEENNK